MDNVTKEAMEKAVDAVVDAVQGFAAAITSEMVPVCKALRPMLSKMEEVSVKPSVPGKLWHLYKHAKKRRARKKNRKRVYSAFWEGRE